MTPWSSGFGDVIGARRPEVSCGAAGLRGVLSSGVWQRRVLLSRVLAAMANACESPKEKGGETGESDETTAAPGGPRVTDTDGIPEETDGDGDGELKGAAAEEGEVGRDVSMRPA